MSKELQFVNNNTYADVDGKTYIYIGTLNDITYFLDEKNLTVRRYLNGRVSLTTTSGGDIVKHTKPKITRNRTINIYEKGEEVFPTNEEAILARKPNALATMNISYTFTEGDGIQ